MFIDEVDIEVRGGTGGDGCAAFLREKFRPWGGPAGGDGGAGGNVILEVSPNADTLLSLYRRKKLLGNKGNPGRNRNCSGRSGEDLVVEVPAGTLVRCKQTGEVVCDLVDVGQRFVVQGGRGGRGNQHFATSTHQTPREFEFGQDGEERFLHLELKLIADAGLIGLPNAGKSTLLSRISSAHPRIASYPFTTTEPHLGIIDTGDYRQVVVADLPGLIEGAHAGAGLGDEFLRHVERTSFLVHLVDAMPFDESDPIDNYRLIENELELYSEVLAQRPRLVVANKIDVTGANDNVARLRDALSIDVLAISAATGEGLKAFLGRLIQEVSKLKDGDVAAW